jgi:hypothetical protein
MGLSLGVLAWLSACAWVAGLGDEKMPSGSPEAEGGTEKDAADAADSSDKRPTPQLLSVDVLADEDSFVASDPPDAAGTNYGHDSRLLTKTGKPTRYSFLKFETSSVPSGAVIDSALLYLYGFLDPNETASNVLVDSYGIMDNSWTEEGITWSTSPDGGSSLTPTTVDKSASWRAWDVTSFVVSRRASGITVISLRLQNRTTTDENCHYYSNNASSSSPRLTITYY